MHIDNKSSLNIINYKLTIIINMIVNIEELATYQAGVERAQRQGQEQEQQKIVLRLLDAFLPEQVAEFSGVPLDKIKTMQEKAKP